MATFRILAAIFSMFGLSMAGLAGPAHADDFYAKKSITLIVGGNPGGGYDLYARALVRHYAKHIPGEPAIVVQHMPGAGSVNLANHLYTRAPKDGLTIGMIFPGVIVGPLLDERMEARFKPTEFIYLGSANNSTRVCATFQGSETRTFDDALKRETVMGGDAPGGSLFDYLQFLRREVGAKFKVVRGYKGSVDILLSMERREVEGICGLDWSSLRTQKPDWVRDNRMHVILQTGIDTHAGAGGAGRAQHLELREGRRQPPRARTDPRPAGVRPAVQAAARRSRRPRRDPAQGLRRHHGRQGVHRRRREDGARGHAGDRRARAGGGGRRCTPRRRTS